MQGYVKEHQGTCVGEASDRSSRHRKEVRRSSPRPKSLTSPYLSWKSFAKKGQAATENPYRLANWWDCKVRSRDTTPHWIFAMALLPTGPNWVCTISIKRFEKERFVITCDQDLAKLEPCGATLVDQAECIWHLSPGPVGAAGAGLRKATRQSALAALVESIVNYIRMLAWRDAGPNQKASLQGSQLSLPISMEAFICFMHLHA